MRRLIEQFLKFGVVGVIAFGIDYGVMIALNALGVDLVLAAGISFTVSVVFNYVASMRFVFTHRDDLSKRREFVIFVILSLVGLAINEAIIWCGAEFWAAEGNLFRTTAVKVFATAVVMVWNFVSRKKWLDAGE